MNFYRYNQRQLFGADMELKGFLRDEDICSTIKQEIVPLINPNDFGQMYSDTGRPPISPVVLTTVTLLQFLEGLSDRAAAFNLRYRIDWKIALGLELADNGIHHSSLSRFRDRLAENDHASYAFDQILGHLSTKGLVKSGGKQRIDSTHVIAKVRELTRIELLWETLRLFCNEFVKSKIRAKPILELVDKYVGKKSTYRLSDQEKRDAVTQAGMDMQVLIAWVRSTLSLKRLSEHDTFTTLTTVFEQNFNVKPDDTGSHTVELIPIASGKGHICSPHDPEAQYSNKGGKGWLGFKAQIAETIPEDDKPGFITFAEVNDATAYDGDSVAPFMEEQLSKNIQPGKVYADTHYNTAANIEALSSKGSELRGPVVPLPKEDPTLEKNAGFLSDPKSKRIVCPAGKESAHFAIRSSGKVYGSFSGLDCNPCSRRTVCQPEPRGKIILIHQRSETLAARRVEMGTKAFKEEMYQRNGIEGTISGLVRGQRMRRSKYCGKAKTRIQIKFAGASANVKRLHQYYGKLHQKQA